LRLSASATRTPRKDRLKIKDRERNDCDNDSKDNTLHKLDLKVPSKSLTDEGFALLADGLQNAFNTCRDLALVDLNLSDNRLTTKSLARLAPLIQASCYTLQTLDLSHNNFQVSTDQQAEEWQLFLQSFRSCMTLRRLDLGHNPSLGYRAFEVLARVYSREPAVDPEPAAGNQSIITLPDSCSVLSNVSLDAVHSRDSNDQTLLRCANGKTLADGWTLKHRSGLRSTPYLTLTNVGLDDTGALFLSYVLEQHYYPIQLVTENNATEASSSIRTYRQDANTKGIDWDNNSEFLSKDGLHLLQCAEKLRMMMLLGDSDSITSSYMSIGVPDAPDTSPKAHSGVGLRRSSLLSVQSADYSMYDKSDIQSARKKIQRNTIGHAGCGSVDLWRASLAAIITSRKVFLLAPVFKMHNTAQSILETGEHDIEPVQDKNGQADQVDMTQVVDLPVTDEHLKHSLSTLSLNSDSLDFEENQAKRSYAATLMTTSPVDSMSPESANADGVSVSNTKILRVGASSSRGHSTGSEGNSLDGSQRLGGHVTPEMTAEECIRFQQNRMEMLKAYHKGESDGYRDASLRCHLPLPVCLEILRLSMSPVDLSHLGVDKQKKAFTWGQKRETLKSGHDWRMKDQSSQLLMLLSGAGCVEYQ
jgi:hypothetical protein